MRWIEVVDCEDLTRDELIDQRSLRFRLKLDSGGAFFNPIMDAEIAAINLLISRRDREVEWGSGELG